jgi:hypothetical protein
MIPSESNFWISRQARSRTEKLPARSLLSRLFMEEKYITSAHNLAGTRFSPTIFAAEFRP